MIGGRRLGLWDDGRDELYGLGAAFCVCGVGVIVGCGYGSALV